MKQLTIGRRMSGLSLVELLIGMTLGLIVMAGVANSLSNPPVMLPADYGQVVDAISARL